MNQNTPTGPRREAIAASIRWDVLSRCNFACFYCGTPAALGIKTLHIDHVIPVALGGTNDPWNLVASCWDCNAGKSSAMPSEELIEMVRGDYCAYSTGRVVIEAQPCAYCSMPVIREYLEDEDPLRPGQECQTCNSVWHDGYEYARKEAKQP